MMTQRIAVETLTLSEVSDLFQKSIEIALPKFNGALGGYSDWYLPSQDELSKLYLSKAAIGGFVNNIYWSSSENGVNLAWLQNFATGNQGYDYKFNVDPVRAVRAF
jgi:Protein of unknown function (DUF1566)